jgi:competence protein ComEA
VGEVPVAPSGTTVGADPGTAVGAGPLDLNRATATDLDTLPGIGPTTALAIVTWRDEQGPFTSVDDLLDVPGIGPAKLEALSGLVVVR